MSHIERWQVRGQSAAVNMMRGVVTGGRVAHAYLFVGPKGVGKATTAWTAAAALLCEADEVAARPCGECASCTDVAARRHVDVYALEPVDDKILIDQVRRLQQHAMLRAVRGRYKVFLIEAIDTATEEAQNALLKVLEEPPGDTVFILIAHRETPLLPTIVSRCVSVRFARLPKDVAASILRERFNYGDAAELGAALGDGSIAQATRLSPEELLERRRAALDFFNELLRADATAVPKIAESWHKRRDELIEIMDILQVWLRDVLLCQHRPAVFEEPAAWLVNFDLVDELAAHARTLQPDAVVDALDHVLTFRRRLSENVGVRSLVDVLFLDLAAAGRAAGVSSR